MRIAIVGPGAIGSSYAYRLARAGHEVTVVARGQRLVWLQREQAIVLSTGERAAVSVRDALDPVLPWDLVLVTVLAPQVAAVLPALRASAARTVMFMFNTFESIEPLREAVGAARCAIGFPGGVFTLLVEGRITPQIRQGSVASDPAWARIFSEAGIPTAVESDMQNWLRTHAAMVVPLMAVGARVYARGRGIAWSEAALHARALATGFAMVRAIGGRIRPPAIAALSRLPQIVTTSILWCLSRTRLLRDLGSLGVAEPRMLIDMMQAAAPDLAAPLLQIRP